MKLSVKMINNQMCKVYFSLSPSEVDGVYEKIRFGNLDLFCDELMSKLLIESYIYAYIESDMLQRELVKKDIIAICEKDIRYLSPLKKGYPLIGVTTFPKLQETIKINIPDYVDYDDEEYLISQAVNKFHRKLCEHGFYYKADMPVVSRNSVVEYDLNYVQDGKVLNTIENQEFDMENDDDIEPTLFMGSRIGDVIILDNGILRSEAIIKKIYGKKIFNQSNYNVDQIASLGFDSFVDFEEEYIDVAANEVYEYKIIDKVAAEILKINNFDFSDELISFYLKRNEENLERAKKQIVLDYLLTFIDIKSDHELISNEDIDRLKYEINLLNLNKLCEEEINLLMLKRLTHVKIINMLREKDIID